MKPKLACSGKEPQHFKVSQLSAKDLFDVQIAENIHEVTRQRRKRGSVNEMEDVTQYEYNLYNAAVKANDYGSFIAGIIHLKFSEDDEIALMNKGIADKENAEYVDYRAFVAEIKELAKQYFSNEE